MKYNRIKEGTTPPYPTISVVLTATEYYRENILNNTLVPDKLYKLRHNRYIELYICGGANNFFTALAYPPAGFWIQHPEEVPGLRYYEGWILKYNAPQHTFDVVITTTSSSYREFRAKIDELWSF